MPIFHSERHPTSNRFAVIDGRFGHSVWLYLTETDEPMPVRDAFIVSRIPPITREQYAHVPKQDGPPPIVNDFLAPGAVDPREELPVAFRWSPDGHAVCALIDGRPHAFAATALERGHSRAIAKSGPWGEPWDDSLYQRVFGP